MAVVGESPGETNGVRPSDRLRFGRFLCGSGLELGAGHNPFPTLPGAAVTYVDRWLPDENQALFPELVDAEFPRPDVVADFDVERLAPFADSSQDFVIASHVLEHVADPLGLLDDIHRVLRPGGSLVLLLPDRTRTFDRDRAPTDLAHIIDEHRRGVRIVDDEHIDDFLSGTDPAWRMHPARHDASARAELFDMHRRRSIHVHCWDQHEFAYVLAYAIATLGHDWEIIDALFTEDNGFEFGYLLVRSVCQLPYATRAERFRTSLALIRPSLPSPTLDATAQQLIGIERGGPITAEAAGGTPQRDFGGLARVRRASGSLSRRFARAVDRLRPRRRTSTKPA